VPESKEQTCIEWKEFPVMFATAFVNRLLEAYCIEHDRPARRNQLIFSWTSVLHFF